MATYLRNGRATVDQYERYLDAAAGDTTTTTLSFQDWLAAGQPTSPHDSIPTDHH